jgi:2-C-methyl-D-erythritol 4-phosphate cytidylyltransferase
LRVGAIIAAAGEGKRFISESDNSKKQFAELGGEPLFLRSAIIFLESPIIDETVVTVPASNVEKCNQLLRKCSDGHNVHVIPGGEQRQESVYNAFSQIRERVEVVIIHDAVRPFLQTEWIEKTVELTDTYDGAIVAIPATDTLKTSDNDIINRTMDRSTVWQAQTPQTFAVGILDKAFEHALALGIVGTDEAQLVETVGGRIAIVEGSSFNIKITTKNDLTLAEAILSMGQYG